MAAILEAAPSQFALDVAEGLLRAGQKQLPSTYLYDELGSVLFDAITLLPEYGLTRADERLLSFIAHELAATTGNVSLVAELGSGTGKKTRHILSAMAEGQDDLVYVPIDVSGSALEICAQALSGLAEIRPMQCTWMDGIERLARQRVSQEPLLLLFLGSSIGNIAREDVGSFLSAIRSCLRKGDRFLLGADLVKPVDTMIAAYDDPTGVTAAFNLNVLGRINRELKGDFDLRSFTHAAQWQSSERRIEMHLVSQCDQLVEIEALNARIQFRAGESIWTESSHKFSEAELDNYAQASGFEVLRTWKDIEWPFAEALWQAA